MLLLSDSISKGPSGIKKLHFFFFSDERLYFAPISMHTLCSLCVNNDLNKFRCNLKTK